MIVTPQSLDRIIGKLSSKTVLAIDTETTGLYPDRGDRLFSVAISDGEETYYFNFNPATEASYANTVIPRTELYKFQMLFGDERITWIMHNAKFDMGMFLADGLSFTGRVWDTEVGARIENNSHLAYSLASCGARIGIEKSNEVEKYIEANGLHTSVFIPGKKTMGQKKYFHRVPFDIISRYAEQDVRVTFALYRHQRDFILSDAAKSPGRNAMMVMDLESKVTKVCFNMERKGVRIDKGYCSQVIPHEQDKIVKLTQEYSRISGIEFADSNKELENVFIKLGVPIKQTKKGNPSFTDQNLELIDHPIAKVIQDIRTATKRLTFFHTLLWMADREGVIHANIRQAGTATGRVSITEPNLQQLPSKETCEFPVRRALIPRDGYSFTMIDYDQMEFKLLLDYIGDMNIIGKVLGGLDVHQATADPVGITRDQAKTTNFAIIYGSGIALLAKNLGKTYAQAKAIKEAVLDSAPSMRRFINAVSTSITYRSDHTIRNWLGRPYRYPDTDFAYRGLNHLIQGGCADAMKIAMVAVDAYLAGKKSNLLIQVHDELLIEVHHSEPEVPARVREIMSSAYKSRHLPLTCSVEYSSRNWFDKEEQAAA
jgi:DNA polymerase-1